MPLINIQESRPSTVSDEQRAATKARQILMVPAMSYREQFNQWSKALLSVWDDPTPGLVLAKLGTKAKELYTLSSMQGQYLASVVAVGCTPEQAAIRLTEIDAVRGKVPACTLHDDGTVTIDQ